MTDYIDKQALLKALEKVSGHADEWISLAGSIHRRIREGEFDAKEIKLDHPMCPWPYFCPNMHEMKIIDRVDALEKRANAVHSALGLHQQSIDSIEKHVERLEKEQADQKEAYPFISVNVPGYAKPMIVRTDSWNKEQK